MTQNRVPDSRSDDLCRAINASGTPGCVGLDPVLDRLPDAVRREAASETDAIERFCGGVLESIVGVVGVVKPQAACFERFGSAGYGVLERTVARARELGFVVILDAKRGDIGSSAEHYAAGAVSMGADWITISPYMGPSTIEPFIGAGLGVFALCRTSNPDSDRLQSLRSGDRSVAEHTAGMLAGMAGSRTGSQGLSDLGAVVGATKSAEDGAALRAAMPDQFLLVPGVGAQGGTPDEVRPLTRPGAVSIGLLGVVVNASRSVLYPSPAPGRSWQGDVRAAAESYARSLGTLSGHA
ncbi:MAG: orotidine-5'-phosphate decarboxylase [Planctomycetota bacterium]